jgi:predicted enzyme related to lactoylglutathione lyase
VKAGGGQVLNGPMEVPGGDWIVQALDPQGAMFAVVGKKAAA